jgi:hypothetical protein
MRVICHKTYLRRTKAERVEIRFTCYFWKIYLLLDPDPEPHSQYEPGSGSRRA